ncbi:MAG: hypothetical protein H7067_13255 [Burkholderiales bacterium]|nr:hypothetical protein [Opitutaceae bacterium]
MNTKIKTILSGALLAVGVLFALPAHAEEGGADKKPRPERPEGGGGGQRGDRLARLVEALELTPEQVEKLKPIFAEEQKEIREARKEAGPDADRAALREKAQAIHAKYKPRIHAVLTEEQIAKLNEMQERRQGGPDGPGGEGKKGEGKKGKKGEGDGAGAPPPEV